MTATSNEAIVLSLLLAHAAEMATTGPTLPLAYPEIAFTVPTDGKYLECLHFPNRNFWEGIDSGKIGQGIFQITVHWPRGSGGIEPLNDAGLVIDHFARGTVLYGSGLRVEINDAPYCLQPTPGVSDYQIPVSIPYRVFYT